MAFAKHTNVVNFPAQPKISGLVADRMRIARHVMPKGRQKALATMLLGEILIRYNRARTVSAGKRWLDKTHDQWCDDLHCTPNQFRRALEFLVKLGLVERARIAPKNKQIAILNVRPVDKLWQFATGVAKKWSIPEKVDLANLPDTTWQICPSYKKEDTTYLPSSQTEELDSSEAPSALALIPPSAGEEPEKMEVGKTESEKKSFADFGPAIDCKDESVKNGIIAVGESQAKARVHPMAKKIGARDLLLVFQKAFHAHTGAIAPQPSGKDLGMASTLLASIGMPPEGTVQLAERVAAEWPQFCAYACQNFAAFNPPTIPTFEWFYARRLAAIAWAASSTKTKADGASILATMKTTLDF